MVYDLLLTYVLPIAAAALVGWFYVKKQLRMNPKPIDSPPDTLEHPKLPFHLNFTILFTGIQIPKVVTSLADILSLAEEICHLCEKSVGTLRLLSDGIIIDPWCKTWKNATLGDLNVFEDKTLFVYFLPMEHDDILVSLGPDGTAEAWAELQQKLRVSKRVTKNLQMQCTKVEKEKSDLVSKNSQISQEKQKLLVKHGHLANEFASAKKKLQTQSKEHRCEMKKIQNEKRNVQKKFESASTKLQEALLEKDRLRNAERDLRDEVARYVKDYDEFQKQHTQMLETKEEVEKENAYLRQRLKNLSYANASLEPPHHHPGHHHHHHHHHHIPRKCYEHSYRRTSSTPSETGNESIHSMDDLSVVSDHSICVALSEQSMHQYNNSNSDHSSPWSSTSSGETSSGNAWTNANDRSKLKIIDDSHYASPTAVPSNDSFDESTHRYKDASRYEVPSFIQQDRRNAAPEGYDMPYY